MTTTANRDALVKIAEGLWTVQQELNRDDVHGVPSLPIQAPGTAYKNVSDALRTVLSHLVDGDTARAERVAYLLIDNYEDVTYNLGVEAREHAERVAEEHAVAAGAHTCKHCGATIAYESPYGWVDQLEGDESTYDACQGDESDGEHEPDCNGACGLHVDEDGEDDDDSWKAAAINADIAAMADAFGGTVTVIRL